MSKPIFLLFILISVPSLLLAQKSEGGKPYSFKMSVLKSTEIPSVSLKALDMETLTSNNAAQTEPVPYGIFTDTLLDVKSAGKKDIITGHGTIWRLEISSPNARSLQVYFSKYVIPEGASLFIYNNRNQNIKGAFTKKNMQPGSVLMLADFEGNNVTIEYFEPQQTEFEGKLVIGSIGQAFGDVLQSESGTSGFININCPIGKNVQLDKHSVAKMSFRSGQYQVTCSGGLINNTRNDGMPYFITANHCMTTQDEASTLVTYYNYEIAGCNGTQLNSPSLSGASLLYTYQPSDFTLVRLNEIPTAEYQPYYAGWDARDNPTDSVTAIHVPYGNTKKISLDYDSIISNDISVTWDDDSRSPRLSHWVIGFDEGSTSQGSSGSPLFNKKHQIIGQLHGGDDIQAYYGKFSYSYSHKATGFLAVSHYLDPDSSGILAINGYYPSENIPDAFFTSEFEQVCHNTPIQLDDHSVFEPYDRQWKITPATFNFVESTSESSEHPIIEFLQDTVYNVTLNLSRNDSVLSEESLDITSGDSINVTVKASQSGNICDCDFNSIQLSAEGADAYTWTVENNSLDKVEFTNSNGKSTVLKRKPEFKASSDYIVEFRVTGQQASCLNSQVLSYKLIKPDNDDIENAALLIYGKSESFDNICASVQSNEPIPPHTDCVSQKSWCDEYGNGENIVENSVWFKFIAGTTGRVTISSSGFDNELALYAADSAAAILNGNYTLIGASDDRSDSDYRPMLTSATVVPGKTYWVQVDGSGGGLEDLFTVTLTSVLPTASEQVSSEVTIVYPQPASDMVYIQNSRWTEHEARVVVYNTSGACIQDEHKSVNTNGITLNTSAWQPGIYIAAITVGGEQFITRIAKK
ncbi:MAG TPA: T9SS type A sorting domain-containing protein [Bacteroidales bacterium]|nr:T9SS type A sorting domain-containing protein [Bacteroidales bacterium]